MTEYVRWPIRPRSVVISHSSDKSAQAATIDQLLPVRSRLHVRLLLHDGSAVWVRITADDAERMELLPGQTLYVGPRWDDGCHRSSQGDKTKPGTLPERWASYATDNRTPHRAAGAIAQCAGNPRHFRLPTTSFTADRRDMMVCAAMVAVWFVVAAATGVPPVGSPPLAGEGLFGAGIPSTVTAGPSGR
jgi:hypothetical protein